MLKIIFYCATLLLAVWGFRQFHQTNHVPKIGNVAPDFKLPNIQGQLVEKSQFQGQWLVLYFYPKDDTPGCTKEACQFRDDLHELERLSAKVVGISVDDTASHIAFTKKYALPFPLLSDSDGQVAHQYGALTNLGIVKIAKRYTFLIDPNGLIAKVYLDVNTSKHSQQIIDDLTALSK